VMFSGEGDGKFGLGFLRDEELDFLMGMRSWRCWRDTEIWRAIEMSAADLRRSSRSLSSLVGSLAAGLGMAVDLGIETIGLLYAMLETSEGPVRIDEEVAGRRFRLVAGGAWIWTCLGVVLCGIEDVEMLDADVDVECPSDREEIDPDNDDGAFWLRWVIICHAGSSNLGFIRKGAPS
jgi:hypothetical protein